MKKLIIIILTITFLAPCFPCYGFRSDRYSDKWEKQREQQEELRIRRLERKQEEIERKQKRLEGQRKREERQKKFHRDFRNDYYRNRDDKKRYNY